MPSQLLETKKCTYLHGSLEWLLKLVTMPRYQKISFSEIVDEIATISECYFKGNPEVLFRKALLQVAKKCQALHKDITRHTKQNVINGLIQHPAATDSLIQYLMTVGSCKSICTRSKSSRRNFFISKYY